jgi:hypothetical protein
VADELGTAAATLNSAHAEEVSLVIRGRGAECLNQRGCFVKSRLSPSGVAEPAERIVIPIPPKALGDKGADTLAKALELHDAVRSVAERLCGVAHAGQQAARMPARRLVGALAFPLVAIVLSLTVDAASVNLRVIKDPMRDRI